MLPPYYTPFEMLKHKTGKELIKLGIKSLSIISEESILPMFLIKFLDKEKDDISFTSVEELNEYITKTLPTEIRRNKIDGLIE